MTTKKYDIFLSHNSACKPAVESIAGILEDEGIQVFLDIWHLVPGEPWQEALEQALENSTCCAVFLGPDGFGTWENEEMRVALEIRVRHSHYRVIPILLPGGNPDKANVPPFLSRMTWVDLRKDITTKEALHPLIAAIHGLPPRKKSFKQNIPLSIGIRHPLPPAPFFTGRSKELNELQQKWESCNPMLLSLIGIGGAGKTAIAAEFLSHTLNQELKKKHNKYHLDSIFVWSFYVDQNSDSFLNELFHHLGGKQNENISGMTIVYRLSELIADVGHCLIILDGLERIQRPYSDSRHMFGEIEDPLLRHFIRRLGAGIGNCICIITSRFPLSDIEMWAGNSYYSIDIDQLDQNDALMLLQNRGVKGTRTKIEEIIKVYGSHALTIDHLGTYLVEFCDGNTEAAHALPEPELGSVTTQERKLARVLRAYDDVLNKKELDLIQRLCLFRFGTSAQTIASIFSNRNRSTSGSLKGASLDIIKRLLNRLVKLHLVLEESVGIYTTHPAVKDHFYRQFQQLGNYHSEVVKHFSSLVSRPGLEKTSDPELLNLLEEIVYHSISAGRIEEAKEVYKDKLGGALHLGFELGEYARGLRILESFPNCPAPEDRLHYLLAIGNLDEAVALCHALKSDYQYAPLFLAGRLTETLHISTEQINLSILHQVKLLMCVTKQPPNPCLFTNKLTCVVHPFLAYHYGNQMRQILVNLRDFKDHSGRKMKSVYNIMWGMKNNAEQKARSILGLAEIDRQEGKLHSAEYQIIKAGDWAARSGSQELLCLLNLTRGRLLRAQRKETQAEHIFQEAIQIAQTFKLTLYHIDLMNEIAELALFRKDIVTARNSLQAALYGIEKNSHNPANTVSLTADEYDILGAKHAACQYKLGSKRSEHLLKLI